jgi:hypothetical protein
MSIWLEAICILCLTGAGLTIAVPALRLRIVATARKNFDMVRFAFFDRRQGYLSYAPQVRVFAGNEVCCDAA